MRFTIEAYDRAIESLTAAKKQIEPDGNECACCGDGGHQAFECGHNPLVAVAICQSIAKNSDTLHDTLHWLSGHDFAFGVQLGPARVIHPQESAEAERELLGGSASE
jgi:hypothetical protein